MDRFPIERHVPLPPNARKLVFPFRELQVGESFLVPETIILANGHDRLQEIRVKCSYHGRLLKRKFIVRRVDEGVRVWRLE